MRKTGRYIKFPGNTAERDALCMPPTSYSIAGLQPAAG